MNSIKVKISLLFLWLIAGTILPACNQPQNTSDTISSDTGPTVDLNGEQSALLQLQATEKEAHLTEQPALLVHMLTDTFCQIKNGEVKYYTHDEMTDRFVKYFYSVEFVKWEDIKPPVITISSDGKMAHILVTKEVEVITSDQDKPTREKTKFAWTELWLKKGTQWKLNTVTTTEKESMKSEE